MIAIRRRKDARRVSQAVLRGDRVYLPGQVAEQTAGEPVAAQTREILARIDRLLAKSGSSKSLLRAAHIRLADMASFAEMNSVWNVWMADGPTPGRATVQAALDPPAHVVEIAVTAAR